MPSFIDGISDMLFFIISCVILPYYRERLTSKQTQDFEEYVRAYERYSEAFLRDEKNEDSASVFRGMRKKEKERLCTNNILISVGEMCEMICNDVAYRVQTEECIDPSSGCVKFKYPWSVGQRAKTLASKPCIVNLKQMHEEEILKKAFPDSELPLARC